MFVLITPTESLIIAANCIQKNINVYIYTHCDLYDEEINTWPGVVVNRMLASSPMASSTSSRSFS